MSWIERYMEIDATKTPAGGEYLLWNRAKQKRGRKVFDSTLEFARKQVFVCRRRTAIGNG